MLGALAVGSRALPTVPPITAFRMDASHRPHDTSSEVGRLLHVATVEVTLRAFFAPVACHFREAGWTVDAAASGTGHIHSRNVLGPSYRQLFDLPLSRNPLDHRNVTRGVYALRRMLLREGYDVVHVMTPIAGFVTRLAIRTLPAHRRPRVVYVAHGFHFFQGGSRQLNVLYRTLEATAARWTDYLGVVNAEDAEAVLQGGWVPPSHLFSLPGVGVDLSTFSAEAFSEAHAEVRGSLGVPRNAPLFLCVAEFTARKRQADLIRAFAASRTNGAHLLLAGKGPLLEACRDLAAREGVAERVHFLGFRHDIPALMAASNAVVLVSEQEGLPTCVIEALALGAAVVGSNIRGTRDLLKGTGNPLVRLGDKPALAAALTAAAAEPPASVRPRSYPHVEQYGLANVLHVHEIVYRAALAGGPLPSNVRVEAAGAPPHEPEVLR